MKNIFLALEESRITKRIDKRKFREFLIRRKEKEILNSEPVELTSEDEEDRIINELIKLSQDQCEEEIKSEREYKKQIKEYLLEEERRRKLKQIQRIRERKIEKRNLIENLKRLQIKSNTSKRKSNLSKKEYISQPEKYIEEQDKNSKIVEEFPNISETPSFE